MFIPSFKKLQSNDPLYFLQEADDTMTVPNYCIAFLPDGTLASTELSLADTWTLHSGIYLFLKAAKSSLNQSALVDSVRRLLKELGNRPIRLLWLENPADPIASWRYNSLSLNPSPGTSNAAEHTVADPTFLAFRNYGLFIAGDSSVTLNDGRDGLLFRRETANPQGFYLSTGFDTVRLYGIADAIELSFAGAIAGCLQTTLTIQKPEDSQGDAGYSELTALDIGFRLFFRDANQSGSENAFAIATTRYPFLLEDGDALPHYPANLTLVPTLDPLNPLDGTRTYFGFGAGMKAISFPSGYCTNIGYTIHLTPHDDQCRLVFAELPIDSFSVADPLFPAPYYLAPAGDYEMSVPRYTPGASQNPADYDDNLICGLSGVEYIKLAVPAVATADAAMTTTPPATAPAASAGAMTATAIAPSSAIVNILAVLNRYPRVNLLCCRPGYPAYAPGFVPQQPAVTENGGAILTNLATTAWAYVRQIDTTPIYYAQPEQALLHSAAISDEGATLDGLLGFLEVPALALPTTPQPFPLLPYSGVQDTDFSTYQQLEQQFLSPQRRTTLLQQSDPTLPLSPPVLDPAESPLPPTDVPQNVSTHPPIHPSTHPPSHIGTTPQGLLATFSADYETLEAITLAKDTENHLLQFHSIGRRSPLRSALQSHQLFLVIARPDSLTPHFTDNQLTIQGWTFDLNPTRWRSETVLIFKFFEEPLIDLLQNLQAWASPAEFVGNTQAVAVAQRRLLDLFQEAIARSGENAPPKDKENYGPLARIAQLSGWSGIVALNVPVPPANLPSELRALAAGIDPSKFYAQYVGVETTPVRSQQGQLIVGQSSLFGLIDYQNETIPLPNPSGYDFEVRNLRVLFQNSQVKAFSSEIAVTLDRLFDEETQLVIANAEGEGTTVADRNIVLLKGTAENHSGRTTYAFSFSGDNHFLTPKSTAFNQVEIIKAQFSTDQVNTPAGQVATITGRFTFWGNLDFARLAISKDPFQFDILSFGADPPPADPSTLPPSDSPTLPPQFLAFSNLVVTMTFREDTPQDRTFGFNPRNLVFDLKRSKPRQDSLYSKFPLKFTGMTYSSGDKTIESFGYMPVKSPVSGKLRSLFTLTDPVLQTLRATNPPTAVLDKLNGLKDREFLDQQAFVAVLQSTLGTDLTDALRKSIVSAARSPQPWYALTFDLELGTLGALAGRAGFVASLIFAWNPGAGSKFFVGLRLPGSTGGKREISLQGVIKLVFKSIDFVVGRNEGRVSYVLKLKNIMLKFLVLSIPPNGRTEIILFGDPAGTAENNQLGWYAAYVKDQ
jgi:hypothetical protein